jgi:hypothetical protein
LIIADDHGGGDGDANALAERQRVRQVWGEDTKESEDENVSKNELRYFCEYCQGFFFFD